MGLRKDLERALTLIEELRKENLELRTQIIELTNRLNQHENANTPSSQQHFKPKTEQDPNKPRFPGAPLNHKGAGIRLPKADKVIEHKMENADLVQVGKYKRTIIDFSDKPLEVIEHIIYQYETPNGVIVEPELDLPKGIYGKNLQAFLSELKAIGGISYEKMADILKTLRPDISICPATILSIIDNMGQNLENPRTTVKKGIQNSSYVNADETGMRQDGQNGYVWVFCNPKYALYEYNPSRARAVAERVLGKDYNGTVVSDGYAAYEIFKQQRCWSHILREADKLAEDFPESTLQAEHLHEIYTLAANSKTELPDKRQAVIKKLSGTTELGHIIQVLKITQGCKKFSGTLERAAINLFIGVENPEIPLHNNYAERTIRPIVIHRKMMGCIRNEKGQRFINNTLSMIQTWKIQGQNIHKNLIKYAS